MPLPAARSSSSAPARFRSLSWMVMLALALASAPPPARAASSPSTFAQWEALVSRAGERGQQDWSVQIEDIETDQTIYAFHPAQELIPASNRKLVAFGMALETFGPDFRFRTDFGLDTPLPPGNAHYHGNVLLVARGDPTFSAPFLASDDNPFDILRGFVKSLSDRGIAYIHGDLILDATAFGLDQDDYPSAWSPRDRNDSYASVPSALAINQNLLRVNLEPGEDSGDRARPHIFPSSTGIDIDNDARTSTRSGGVNAAFEADNVTLHLTGTVRRRGDGETLLVPLRRPLEYAADNLRAMLKARGISLTGRIVVRTTRADDDPTSGIQTLLASHQSPPLSDILKVMMRVSDNFIAEQLWRAAAARVTTRGDIPMARAVEARWYRNQGKDGLTPGWDGSGLSRLNKISAADLADIAHHLYHTPYRGLMFNCLPVSGKSGTLRGRNIGGDEGRVTAKTGTLTGVSALTGFIHDDKGRPRYVFSILGNAPGETGGLLTQRIDQLLSIAIRHLDNAD